MKDNGRSIIFDCDGVLVDSEPLGLPALEKTLLSFGFQLDEFDVEMCCGRTDEDSIREICRLTGKVVDIPDFLVKKNEDYRAAVEQEGLRTFPGVRELLDNLQTACIPLALASSGSPLKIQVNLEAASLTSIFSIVVSGEQVENGKPAPDIFLEAARRLGAEPSTCTVIEDSPAGLMAGRAAGMRVVAVTHTFPREELEPLADRVVGDISALSLSDI